MKNLLVPAAIAIGGFFVVGNIADYDSVNCVRPSVGKHDQARHHRQFINQDVDAVANEVPANAIKVVNFAPVAEEVASFFFNDISGEQTKNSDLEINSQMEANAFQISIPDSKKGDLEINSQMEANMVEISVPDFKMGDLEIKSQMEADIVEISIPDSKKGDLEINSQMEANIVEISIPDFIKGDLEINSQMEKSLVSISVPNAEIADMEMTEKFTAN